MKKVVIAGTVLSAVVLFSCGGDGSTTSTSPSQNTTQSPVTVTLTKAEIDDILFMREEEKLARDVYRTLYQKYNTQIFQNISQSEQRHMDAMANLIKVYNLQDPVVDDSVGKFTNQTIAQMYTDLVTKGQQDYKSALYVGAYIEEHDIEDLARAINTVKQNSNAQNIISTYQNLMCGSRNHLRGFAKEIKTQFGEDYKAQILSQEEVNKIISTPNEKCGAGF